MTERSFDITQFMEEPAPGRFFLLDNDISVTLCKTLRGWVVFGDNVLRWGKKGAAVIRDEPNAIGVATKWKPRTTRDAYFSDSNQRCWDIIFTDLLRVESKLLYGEDVYWPKNRVGVGLAKLPEKAPKLFERMNQYVDFLRRTYPCQII